MLWHQLDHVQTICTPLQTGSHINTSSLNFFTGQMLFLTPNRQCQSSEELKRNGFVTFLLQNSRTM